MTRDGSVNLLHASAKYSEDFIRRRSCVNLLCLLLWPNSAVATRGEGGDRRGARPLKGCFSFWFTQSTIFGTSREVKTTENDGQMNDSTQTEFTFDIFSIAKLLTVTCGTLM